MSAITVGSILPTLEQASNLTTSVMYAGASGDMNPLHYDPAFAAQVSPTGATIVHGMFSMGLASRLVTGFAGGPEQVLEIAVRFTKPWPLGTSATFGGEVTAVEDGRASISLWGQNDAGEQILKGTAKIAV
jgi:acyl dehydratase